MLHEKSAMYISSRLQWIAAQQNAHRPGRGDHHWSFSWQLGEFPRALALFNWPERYSEEKRRYKSAKIKSRIALNYPQFCNALNSESPQFCKAPSSCPQFSKLDPSNTGCWSDVECLLLLKARLPNPFPLLIVLWLTTNLSRKSEFYWTVFCEKQRARIEKNLWSESFEQSKRFGPSDEESDTWSFLWFAPLCEYRRYRRNAQSLRLEWKWRLTLGRFQETSKSTYRCGTVDIRHSVFKALGKCDSSTQLRWSGSNWWKWRLEKYLSDPAVGNGAFAERTYSKF